MDRRIKFKQGLSSLYLPYYESLCDSLPPEWQPYFGFRTFAEQDALWKQGRESPGHIVTNAKGGQSAHNYGCATDWTIWVNDQPVWMPKEDPRWKIYVDAVTASGLRPGLEFGDIDHNELKISCDWPHILIAFDQNGSTAAQQKIEEAMI